MARLCGTEPPGLDVLWISEQSEACFRSVSPTAVRHLLGQSFDVVVLDLHRGLVPDILGQCHGFVWGGGILVLRMPPEGEVPVAGTERLAVFPFTEADVGLRLFDHFERTLRRAQLRDPGAFGAQLAPTGSISHDVHGTDEQAEVVRRLVGLFTSGSGVLGVITSDRGRGKSSALGLALAESLRLMDLRVAVTAGHAASTAEVFRFALGSPHPPGSGRVRFVPVAELIFDPAEPASRDFDVIVVDEAAQLPVPILQRLVRRHGHARIAFATTTRGYEGTGRGFMLRFLDWLACRQRPLELLALEQPIRWDDGDPVERFVFDALLLDAEAATVETPVETGQVEHVCFDRDELVRDTATLRDFFGLLVHAHYRTTPGDLHRILDAPNLRLHALRCRGRVVAATLVAYEGGLPAEVCEDLYWGRGSIRGHALPDSLVSHLGHREAGGMQMLRSIRIAVHPEFRRQGLGLTLIEHIHRSYTPDLFGTLFGTTPELLHFRRRAGYEVVRISASRGSRTGEPSVVMLRPISERAIALFGELRAELARDLPLQLELLQADGELLLDPQLGSTLAANLPDAAPLSAEELRKAVAAYVFGPRTCESVALALIRFVEANMDHLGALSPSQRGLIQGRVLGRHSWSRVMRDTAQPNLRVTMRALRRAMNALALLADPELPEIAAKSETAATSDRE